MSAARRVELLRRVAVLEAASYTLPSF